MAVIQRHKPPPEGSILSATGGMSIVRKTATAMALVGLGAATSASACQGDLEGAWERRPANTTADFEPVEEFRLDSRTGRLEECTRDVSFDARLMREGTALTFLYRAKAQRLFPVTPGVYLSSTTTRELDGQRWEYRYRLIER